VVDAGFSFDTLVSSLSSMGAASGNFAVHSVTGAHTKVLPLVDYSDFSKHVYFGDAVRKFNVALTGIIQNYPIGLNGFTTASLCAANIYAADNFRKNSTGFQLWLLDQFSLSGTLTAGATNAKGQTIPLTVVYRNSVNVITGSQTAITNSVSASATSFESGLNFVYQTPGSANDGTIYAATAEQYVARNINLKETLPDILFLNDTDNNLERLLAVLGDELDNLKSFIDQMSHVRHLSYGDFDRTPNKYLPTVAKQFGVDLFQTAVNSSFDDFFTDSVSGLRSEEISFEIWNRILNNLMYLIKTKGTKKCIEAITNLYGLNQNFVRINEYSTFKNPLYVKIPEYLDTPVLFSTGDVYAQTPTASISSFDFGASSNFTIEMRVSATAATTHRLLTHPAYRMQIDASGRAYFITNTISGIYANIVSNSAFENGTTGLASAWIKSPSIIASAETTTVHAGSSAQRLEFSTWPDHASRTGTVFAQQLTGLPTNSIPYGITGFIDITTLTGSNQHTLVFRIGPNSGLSDWQTSTTATTTGTYGKSVLTWTNTASTVWVWLQDYFILPTGNIYNYISNTGFEIGFDVNNTASGWIKDSSITTTITAGGGQYTGTSAQVVSFSASTNSTCGSQVFATQLTGLTANTVYGLSSFINIQVPGTYGMRLGTISSQTGAPYFSTTSSTSGSYIQLTGSWSNTATTAWLSIFANNSVSSQVFIDNITASPVFVSNTALIDSVSACINATLGASITSSTTQSSLSSFIQSRDNNFINIIASRIGDNLKIWTMGLSGSGSGNDDIVILASGVTTGLQAINLHSSGGAMTFGTYFPGSGSFSGYMQEIRVWNVALEEEDLKEHCRNFQSIDFQNSTASNSATYGSLRAHYRLKENHVLTGAYNFIVDSTTANASAIPINFQSVNRYKMIPSMEKFSFWYPASLAIDDDKITQDDVSKNMLDPGYISVAFDPINVLNREILNSKRDLNIANSLGDPEDLYRPSYTGPFVTIRQDIFTRFNHKLPIDFNSFNRSLKNFSDTIGNMFVFMYQFIPAKSNMLSEGLTIKNHILERPKNQREYYTVSSLTSFKFGISNHFLLSDTSVSAATVSSFQGYRIQNPLQQFISNSISSERNLPNLSTNSSVNTPRFSSTRVGRLLTVKSTPSSPEKTELDITVSRIVLSPTASPSAFNGNIYGRFRILRGGKPVLSNVPAMRFEFPVSGDGTTNLFKAQIGDIANNKYRDISGKDRIFSTKTDIATIEMNLQLADVVRALSTDTTSLSGTLGIVPIRITNLFSNVTQVIRVGITNDNNILGESSQQVGIRIQS